MASLQHLKKRLTGIEGIHQMTAAMELVSATKMRRAQESALASRPYAITALEILANLVEGLRHEGEEAQAVLRHPLIAPRKVLRTAILLVAADKGLAGSFNSSVFKALEQFLTPSTQELPLANSHLPVASQLNTFSYIAVGQKAHDYLKRKNISARDNFLKYGDIFEYEEITPLADLLREGYEAREWDRVVVFSTHFRSALKQEVLRRELLPIDVQKIRATVEEIIPETGRYAELRKTILEQRPARPIGYLIEPNRTQALDTLLPLLFKMQIYHLILEANASEHSARRMAMKNATDNAGELIDELTLEFNRSRQAAITKEIIEITGTAAALK